MNKLFDLRYDDALDIIQHRTREQEMKEQEKNITEDFADAWGREWQAELNIEYEGDGLVSWCHISTTRNGQDYCSSIGVVEAFGTVEGDHDGDCITVPTALYKEIQQWADEEGY